jgi:hypothetical protein
MSSRLRSGNNRSRSNYARASTAFIACLGVILLGLLVAITFLRRLQALPTAGRVASGHPRLIFDNLMEFKVGIGPTDDGSDASPVRMRVLSEAPHYWRGRVYDRYDGHSWASSFGAGGQDKFAEMGQKTPDGLSTFTLTPVGPPRMGAVRNTHRFHLNSGVYGPLYACAEPRRVRAPVLHIIQRDDNTIGSGRGLGTDYEVDSDVVDPKASDLRTSGTDYPEAVTETYLGQGRASDALQKLAQEATAGAPANPYDRAQSIRRFIANRCVYTRAAKAVPADRDAAESFLNESKEGYSDLYATAMTVLCRYAGLPARMVTGFAPGSVATDQPALPPVGANDKQDKRTWYVLRDSDRHAWTEVYFVGYGWIPFDSTQDTRSRRATDAPSWWWGR